MLIIAGGRGRGTYPFQSCHRGLRWGSWGYRSASRSEWCCSSYTRRQKLSQRKQMQERPERAAKTHCWTVIRTALCAMTIAELLVCGGRDFLKSEWLCLLSYWGRQRTHLMGSALICFWLIVNQEKCKSLWFWFWHEIEEKVKYSKVHFQPFLQPFCSHCIKGIVFGENNWVKDKCLKIISYHCYLTGCWELFHHNFGVKVLKLDEEKKKKK